MSTSDGWVSRSDRDRAIGVLEDARADLEEVRDIALAQLEDATVPDTAAGVRMADAHAGIELALYSVTELITSLTGRAP